MKAWIELHMSQELYTWLMIIFFGQTSTTTSATHVWRVVVEQKHSLPPQMVIKRGRLIAEAAAAKKRRPNDHKNSAQNLPQPHCSMRNTALQILVDGHHRVR